MSTFSQDLSFRSFNTTPIILQVIPTLGNGGVEIETLEIAHAIVHAGGKALIAANIGKAKEKRLNEEINFKNLPLDTKNPLKISKNVKLLKELILKEKVDIVHVRSRAPAWSAYKATRALGVPLVTTYHAAYSSRTVFKTFYNSIMAKGDRVIAISQFILDHLLERYGEGSWFDPSKLRLIQRGIDPEVFNPDTLSDEHLKQLRKSWGISPEMRLILLPGRISRSKGQDLLIEALSRMRHAEVTAVLLGSAQGHETYRDNLLQLASSLDLEGRVKWIPPFLDMPLAYQLADIVVCPSFVPEGFGRVLAEAQAMRKPIVSSNHGAAREVIKDGVTGWLTPPGEPNALAQALDDLLDLPPDTRDEMGKKGRMRVKSYFSKDAMISKTLAVYDELLRERNHPCFTHG